jgi:hypothetical protein
MSNLTTHEAEQAAITAQYEAAEKAAQREYAFDVRLWAIIRVQAKTEAEARALLAEKMACTYCNGGAWPDGSPILFMASVDDDMDLIEIDGEATA